MVGSNLSRALTGSASMAGILAATTFLTGPRCLLARPPPAPGGCHASWKACPRDLVRDGKSNRHAVLRGAITRNDIKAVPRESKVEHIADTRLITVKPSGRISVPKAG